MDVEIIMPLEGMYTVVVDKEQYILNPCDFIMIPPGVMHELFAPPSGKRLIVQCDNSLLNGLVGIDSLAKDSIRVYSAVRLIRLSITST